MNLAPNTILANKYKLVRRLGEGGMGCVWVADHVLLDRQVAIKVISNRVISDPTVRERFEIEARATAKVDSPHVVRVLDFDYTEAGQPFLVLELLVGETLEQRLANEGVLSLNDARELLKQTTHALAEAHRAAILHRDIKADNLFLVAGDDLFVKLLDFGIAIRRDQPSIPDSALSIAELSPIGTPLYMSPEQTLALGPVDERSDLYSLAICLYYALTGDFPFCADSLAVLAFAQQREDFTLPSVRRPELGSALDAFFLRALAFHPEDRFSSAEKMYDAFCKACDRENVRSEATTLRPPGSRRHMRSLAASMRTEMKPRRKRSRGPAVFLVAATVAGVGFFMMPRAWLPNAPPAISSAAAFIASRVPTAQVSAATEPGPAINLDRPRQETRASMLALPLPLSQLEHPSAQPIGSVTAKSEKASVPTLSINAHTPKITAASAQETADARDAAGASGDNVTVEAEASSETANTSSTSSETTTNP